MKPSSEEYLTVAEAADELGVSNRKIADLIKSGALPTRPSLLDKRVKMIRRADVERLKRESPKRRAA